MNSIQPQNLVTISPSMNILIKQLTYTQYIVPVTGPIGEIYEHGEITKILADATAKDEIHIQLSSPGGSLETCDYLCRRMDECEATIVVETGLTCASAASAIALHADEWVIHDSSTMMVHACSYSPGYGKESDVRLSVAYTERVNREWVERTYAGFLTDEEFVDILDNGKDLYFFVMIFVSACQNTLSTEPSGKLNTLQRYSRT